MTISTIKPITVVIFILCITQICFGQKTVINANAYSGLFAFRGQGSTPETDMYAFMSRTPNYTQNPYGNKSAFSYAIEVQGQRFFGKQHFYGSGISFETLKSKVHISRLIGGDLSPAIIPVTGKTILTNTFITVNPFIGQRFAYHPVLLDVMAGVDFGFTLQSKESGKAILSEYYSYTTNGVDRKKPVVDIRPRIQAKAQYKKVGLIAGYSFGITKFSFDLGEGPYKYHGKPHTNLLRLGVSYQIR